MNKEHLFSSRSANNVKTFFLMAVFFVGIVFLGFLFTTVTGNTNYLWGAIFASLVMNFVGYFFSKKIALFTSRAVLADENKYQELHQIVENLSQKAHIMKPDVYIINDPGPNAFATGRNEYNAAVAVTTGLLAMMNKNELEGVIAHELSHIKNKDILIMTIVVVLAGTLSMIAHLTMQRSLFGSDSKDNGTLGLVISLLAAIVLPLAATIVQLSISRKREFVADADGALVTGYPDGLASALLKISTYKQPLHHATPATAHLYISCPFGGTERQTFFQKLFMTHPPVADRIKALIGDKELN